MLVFFGAGLMAQTPDKKPRRIDGHIVKTKVDDCDTLLLAELDDVTVTAPKRFGSHEDYLKYLRYRRYAAKVYPYAVESIRLYRELEEDSKSWNKRKKRREIRKLNREVMDEFKDPLKDLTKTQGYILQKMIERELDVPFYYLMKELRNGFHATYWSTLGGLYGYKLSTGYIEGEDPILDMVLKDYNISHDAAK